jgi:hypothetical protein
MTKDEEEFERHIAHYIEAGMPKMHDMSPSEYHDLCWRLWKECKTDAQYPHKLLIDRLYGEGSGTHPFDPSNYADARALASVDLVKRPADPIYCMAIGSVPLTEWFSDSVESDHSLPGDDLSSDDAADDLDLWIVAVLDVLGFEQMYRRDGPYRLKQVYEALIERARSSLDTSVLGICPVAHSDGRQSPSLFFFNLEFTYFSDTLLLWAPLTANHVSPFLARCCDVFLEGLKLGVPIRGAVAVGEAVLNKKTGVFLGSPLIEAARLEHAQNWLGVALGRSCQSIKEYLDSSLVLPYTPPCKSSSPLLHSGLVLDWPRRARMLSDIDTIALIEKMNCSETHSKYYVNALEFVSHSSKHAEWNRDRRIPIIPGVIERSVLAAALDGRPLEPEIYAMLDSLKSNGPAEELASRCFLALSQKEILPEDANSLPAQFRKGVEHLQGVIDGKFIHMREMVFACLEAGSRIRELSERQMRVLSSPPSPSNQMLQEYLPLLRAAAERRVIPSLPTDCGKEIAELFDPICRTDSPPVDTEQLLAGVLWANSTLTTLSGENHRRLATMRGMGAPWDGVADYLKAVADGARDRPAIRKFNEEALSTIKAVNSILDWQKASLGSLQEAMRGMEALPVTSSQLTTLLDGMRRGRRPLAGDDNGDSKAILATLREYGSPHDAVARYLEKLSEDALAEIPGGIEDDARAFLELAQAIRIGDSITFPTEHVIRRALAVRNGEDVSLYDDAISEFYAAHSNECREIVHYVRALAQRLPLPILSDTVKEPTRSQLTSLAGVPVAPKDIATVGRAALRARLGLGGFDSEDREFIEEGLRIGGAYAISAEFLNNLAIPGQPPPLPDGALAHHRQQFAYLRACAACGVEEIDFDNLVNAALSVRVFRNPLSTTHQDILSLLLQSDSPFPAIAAFIEKICKPGSPLKVPEDLPTRFFNLLAIARRQARDLDNSVIGVGRISQGTES